MKHLPNLLTFHHKINRKEFCIKFTLTFLTFLGMVAGGIFTADLSEDPMWDASIIMILIPFSFILMAIKLSLIVQRLQDIGISLYGPKPTIFYIIFGALSILLLFDWNVLIYAYMFVGYLILCMMPSGKT